MRGSEGKFEAIISAFTMFVVIAKASLGWPCRHQIDIELWDIAIANICSAFFLNWYSSRQKRFAGARGGEDGLYVICNRM